MLYYWIFKYAGRASVLHMHFIKSLTDTFSQRFTKPHHDRNMRFSDFAWHYWEGTCSNWLIQHCYFNTSVQRMWQSKAFKLYIHNIIFQFLMASFLTLSDVLMYSTNCLCSFSTLAISINVFSELKRNVLSSIRVYVHST